MSESAFPTLIPTTSREHATAQFTHVRLSSESQLRNTYYSLVEAHTLLINAAIEPLVKQITSSDHRIINQYQLGSSIGHGQFGKVYKAYSSSTGAMVAIKMITKKPLNNQYSMNQTMRQIQAWKSRGLTSPISGDEAVMLMNVQKCRWEIYIMSRLCNQYVISCKESLDSPRSKSIYVVNEWCNLGELQWHRRAPNDVLPQWQKLLPQCDVLSFTEKALVDLTLGLNYLKSQGCIHRDIKPSNILVDGDKGVLKISDFGCSVLTPESLPFKEDSMEQCYQAELNKIVGTPAFIAPELCHFEESSSDNTIDGFQLDIWSLGITLYCLLHNDLPFYGDNEFDTYQRAMNSSLEPRLNGQFVNDLIISRLLQKDPAKRIDISTLANLVLPRDSTIKSKPIQKFFNKLWKFKPNKKSQKKAPLQADTLALNGKEHALTSDSSSAFSDDDEPVQVTEFMTAKPLSHKHQDTTDQSQSTNERMSILSISPIKLATPIKALIRIRSSPATDKSDKSNPSPSSRSPSRLRAARKKSNIKRLAHSHDIVNFKQYIQPGTRNTANDGDPSTPEDIEEYLRFADTK